MQPKVVAEPTALAISVEEAKQHCEYLDNDRDAYFVDLIRAATDHLERDLEITIMERTLRMTYDRFSDEMELPLGPVSQVLGVEYYDAAGLIQNLDPSAYSTDLDGPVAWVLRNAGSSYPVTMSGVRTVRLTYKAGVPVLPPSMSSVKHAIKLIVGHFFANREAVTVGTVMEVPLALQLLIRPLRRWFV